MRAHPEWRVGSTVTLRLNSKIEGRFVIVGTFPFAQRRGQQAAFASYNYVADLLNQRVRRATYRLVTAPSRCPTQDRCARPGAAMLEEAGYKATVDSGHTIADALFSILNIIVLFLLGWP
jgi:hypothetical protein